MKFKSLLKWLFIALPLLSLVIIGALGMFVYSLHKDYQQKSISLDKEHRIYSIPKGSSIRKISRELEAKGILKPAWQFELLARITKQHNNIKAGEYLLKKGMRPSELLKQFVSGKGVQYKAIIVEGKTFFEMLTLLKKNKDLIHTLTEQEQKHIMTTIGSQEKSPEGWFYPDTYLFPKGTTDKQFLQRAHKKMSDYLQKAWEGRQKEPALKSPYDALILASIVEKETGSPSDRGKIARVFINRLDKKMRLQTDPTVIYGMGDRFKGNIRKKDLRRDTAYNTYTRRGLTPTPIAIPSKAAIDAVMHPADGKMLYFVAKGDGTSYFSNSYKEHRQAVIKYLLGGDKKRYKGGR